MFSSDFIKSFVLLLALVSVFFPSCRNRQNSEAETPAPTPAVSELKSEIPFLTKEPQIFQAEIVTTANGQERKTFAAKNGANRHFDFDFGAKHQFTVLQTEKNYLLLPDKKIYAENIEKQFAPEGWTDFLTTEWLNTKTEAKFERLETERNLTKYSARLGAGDFSEVLIYVDEAQGFPVRQEFYSIDGGGQKTLTFSVELKNIKMQTDDGLFAVPKDFRQVSADELRKTLRNIQE